MDATQAHYFVDGIWDRSIVPSLTEYIKIPNKSPLYDPAWESAGHMDRAMNLIEG